MAINRPARPALGKHAPKATARALRERAAKVAAGDPNTAGYLRLAADMIDPSPATTKDTHP